MTLKRATTLAACLLGLLSLSGCASDASAPEIRMSSNRRPTTYPLGRLRFDGIYECRGLKTMGSSGGLPGVWERPQTQVSLVFFLKFDAQGNVFYVPDLEPSSTGRAALLFEQRRGDPYKVTGKYTLDGSNVAFVLTGLTADGQSESHTSCTGVVYEDYIALQEHSAYSPEEYHEYIFVKWPP